MSTDMDINTAQRRFCLARTSSVSSAYIGRLDPRSGRLNRFPHLAFLTQLVAPNELEQGEVRAVAATLTHRKDIIRSLGAFLHIISVQ